MQPQVIENQSTYPLTTAMLTVPKSRWCRGFSFFGVSLVYIIFEGWYRLSIGRARVCFDTSTPPPSAAGRRTLRPDATGVGVSINRPAVADKSLADLRSLRIGPYVLHFQGRGLAIGQRGRLRPATTHSRSEPDAVLGIPLAKVRDAVRGSNMCRRPDRGVFGL